MHSLQQDIHRRKPYKCTSCHKRFTQTWKKYNTCYLGNINVLEINKSIKLKRISASKCVLQNSGLPLSSGQFPGDQKVHFCEERLYLDSSNESLWKPNYGLGSHLPEFSPSQIIVSKLDLVYDIRVNLRNITMWQWENFKQTGHSNSSLSNLKDISISEESMICLLPGENWKDSKQLLIDATEFLENESLCAHLSRNEQDQIWSNGYNAILQNIHAT